MKRVLLLILSFLNLSVFAQESFNFSDCQNPGFILGQGAQIGGYNNPNSTPACEEDCGIITPGVGGNNPSNFATPVLTYSGGNFINFTFQLYVFTANLACGSNQVLPCETRAQAYIVPSTYNSNQPPQGSDLIASSNIILVSALGGLNNLFFTGVSTNTLLQIGTTYRVYVDFSVEGNCNQGGLKYVIDNIRILETQPGPLPVKFSMFAATRNKSNVSIKWETSQEINNQGFYVQRNIRGTWETVAFVPSQAQDGNSNSPLTYTLSDLNTTKGVTQYRIMQVDLDGKSKYSDIRSVKGEAMSGKTLVYPNPSLNGNVNVVFDDQQPKNVVISDMNGRVIRKYNSAVNNLSVDNLENGVYSIQVIDLSTSAVSVEKVVVKKR